MPKRTLVPWIHIAVALIGWSSPAGALAQSPYGLGARQTIPLVVAITDDLSSSIGSEVYLHNPGSLPVTVQPTYFPISVNAGAVGCAPVTVAPGGSSEFRLWPLCNVPAGVSFGRLELSSLFSIQPGEARDPGGRIFEAASRLWNGGALYTVESFPQGRLSGNRRFADVLGLKNGADGSALWRTDCYATALGEPSPVFVRLFDGAGNQLGNFASAVIDPTLGIEGAKFVDIFNLVGAPGNWTNIRAAFSTAAQGGVGGAGVFGFCGLVNLSTGAVAFSIAKYLDSNDDGQAFDISETHSRTGDPFAVISEIDSGLAGRSNLHVAYFQHPDRVKCSIRFLTNPPNLAVFNLGHMRLIDPDDTIVAGGQGAMEFSITLRDKSIHNSGRNGRWLIEIGPDAAFKQGGGLHKGGLATSEYSLTCSTGNGVNQLEIIGHCAMPCVKGKSNELNCSFVTPFNPNQCYY